MDTAELIFKYRHLIDRMCKLKVNCFTVNGQWYRIDWGKENRSESN